MTITGLPAKGHQKADCIASEDYRKITCAAWSRTVKSFSPWEAHNHKHHPTAHVLVFIDAKVSLVGLLCISLPFMYIYFQIPVASVCLASKVVARILVHN